MSCNSTKLRKVHTYFILCIAPLAQASEPVDIWSRVDASVVCPVASVWRIDTDSDRAPSEMLETVVPLEVDGQRVWRIMHTMLRSTERARGGVKPASDMLDLEQRTLAPVQSEHHTEGRSGEGQDEDVRITRFDFRAIPDAVLRLNGDGSVAERIELEPDQRVFAEPGAAVLDQAIAWHEGLSVRGYTVDRWRGREQQRLRTIAVTVTGRELREIAGRKEETFVVVVEKPVGGAVHVVSWITTSRPHRRVRVEYYAAGRSPDARPIISEVSAVLNDPSCAQMR